MTDYPILMMVSDDKYKIRLKFDLNGDIDAQLERGLKILKAYRQQVLSPDELAALVRLDKELGVE